MVCFFLIFGGGGDLEGEGGEFVMVMVVVGGFRNGMI